MVVALLVAIVVVLSIGCRSMVAAGLGVRGAMVAIVRCPSAVAVHSACHFRRCPLVEALLNIVSSVVRGAVLLLLFFSVVCVCYHCFLLLYFL
jgi:hypothetical protein